MIADVLLGALLLLATAYARNSLFKKGNWKVRTLYILLIILSCAVGLFPHVVEWPADSVLKENLEVLWLLSFAGVGMLAMFVVVLSHNIHVISADIGEVLTPTDKEIDARELS